MANENFGWVRRAVSQKEFGKVSRKTDKSLNVNLSGRLLVRTFPFRLQELIKLAQWL